MNPSNDPALSKLKPENALPVDFDGTFKFTNFTDSEFKAKWNSVEYTFPPLKTVPMIISNATPLEVQSIRKKFAKELAIREWYKTPKFVGMNAHVPGGTPALYTDSDIAPLIQRCLEPLPIARATVEVQKSDIESKLSVDAKGRKRTRVLEPTESLIAQASSPIEE
jgi:hypothetical protein